MDKDKIRIFVKEKKPILLAIAGAVLLLLIILFLSFMWQGKEKSTENANVAAAVLQDELEKIGLEFFPEDPEQARAITELSADVLSELSDAGMDRESMLQSLKEAILGFDSGLADEEAQQLSERLVDWYIENEKTIQNAERTVIEGDASAFADLRKDLENMAAYLEQMDASVTLNKEELQNLITVQGDNLDTVQEYLKTLETAVSELKNEFNSYETDEALMENVNEVIRTELANVGSLLGTLYESIANTQNEILVELANAELSDNEKYEGINNRISDLNVSLNQNLEEIDGHISNVLNDLLADNDEQNSVLLKELQSVQKELSALLAEANINVDDKMSELMGNLELIHNNIISSQLDSQQMLTDMSSADSSRMEQLLERFRGITEDLAEIDADMDSMRELIAEVQTSLETTASENQLELLAVLNNMDSSFSQANTEGFTKLLESLQSQGESIHTQFDLLNESLSNNVSDLNQNIATNNAEMLNRLETMESNINSTVNNIGQGASISQEAILSRLDQMEEDTSNRLSGLSGEIQSVFQRVSNGKALLASALLTKNVVIDEDATFQEIHDAIMNIEQEIVIGVDQIPGIIEYEYHYHTGNAESGGGCYTLPDVHQHVGSCYQVCEVRYDGCGGLPGDTSADSISRCPYKEWHSYCYGGEYRIKEYRHYNGGGSQSGHRSGGSYTHLVTTCGKQEGQSYGWKTACGLNDGQIIGAHIVYDADAVSETAATYVKKAEESGLSMDELEKLLDSVQINGGDSEVYVPEEETVPTEENEVESAEEVETETEAGEQDTEAVGEETMEEIGTEEEKETETETDKEMESEEDGGLEDVEDPNEEVSEEMGTEEIIEGENTGMEEPGIECTDTDANGSDEAEEEVPKDEELPEMQKVDGTVEE